MARIIQRPGKPGGGYVRLLAGLSFFAVTWISVVGMFRLLTSLSASQSWPAHLTADGLLFGAVGTYVAFLTCRDGLRHLRNPVVSEPQPQRTSSIPSREDFMNAASASQRPYFACIRCRTVFASDTCAGPCLLCHSRPYCLEVRNDEDQDYMFISLKQMKGNTPFEWGAPVIRQSDGPRHGRYGWGIRLRKASASVFR